VSERDVELAHRPERARDLAEGLARARGRLARAAPGRGQRLAETARGDAPLVHVAHISADSTGDVAAQVPGAFDEQSGERCHPTPMIGCRRVDCLCSSTV
jgi:hypothetical protein